jgi:nucleoside-diphosphate-sugar epimerase
MSAADIDHRRKRMTEKMEKKIIAVVGATGAQGGGLVRAILADPAGPFTARALTRNPDAARARELAVQGVEVVEADLDDEGSLRQAFDGAYGAFVVTNFWAQRTPEEEKARTRAEMELAQAAAAARAAKAGTAARGVVHPRGHPAALRATRQRRPDHPGQLQGSEFRREGRGERVLHRTRSADHLPVDDLLLRGFHHRARPSP